MKMAKWIVAITFLILLFLCVGYVYKTLHQGELANKPFWALLQGFSSRNEYTGKYNANKLVSPVFVKAAITYEGGYYDLLGIPTRDSKFPYFWISTSTHVDNDESLPDRVYSITAGKKFYLTCSHLEELGKNQKIDEVVNAYLRSRCIDDP